MSYLPSTEAGFYEAIQVYFTEITGRAALFGARDQVLLKAWKEEGRPAQVVCRGIREAAASLGEKKHLRSLGQCESFVDDQWERAREQNVGAHGSSTGAAAGQESQSRPESPPAAESGGGLFEEARRAIESAGKKTEEGRWREAYRQAWRVMKTLHDERGRFSFEEVEVVDQALVQAYLEALDDEEHQVIESAMASVSAGLVRGMSPVARREHLHIRRKRVLIREYGLLDLIERLG